MKLAVTIHGLSALNEPIIFDETTEGSNGSTFLGIGRADCQSPRASGPDRSMGAKVSVTATSLRTESPITVEIS